MGARGITDGLGAFLPGDVRLALARGDVLPDRGHGSVLEADVSSFTPLTEELARRYGVRRGAEEVAALLTRVYGPIVAQVDRFAGSVVEFTGDAVSCCFHHDDGLRALHCGLAMQAAMAALQTDTADSPALKVAVATGAFRRFSVGNPQIRRLEVLAGPAVELLATVAPRAGPGQVLVDAATARRLGSALELAGPADHDTAAVHGVPRPAPAGAPPPPDIDAARARPWLHAPVHDRLLEDGEHLLGDLRSVVALFAGFEGIDWTAEQAGQQLDAYVTFAQRTLDDYGGTLFNVAVDAKGSHLCAGFGALFAHDDDPLRAASAALALRAPPPSAGDIRVGGIGLTRGRLYAGTYGGHTRRTFGLQGSTMILAARLMQSARPSQIVIEESLAADLVERHHLRQLAARQVKGHTTPIDVRELLGPQRPSVPAPAAPHMVNRQHEREALEARLLHGAGGSGGVVVIEGEPGIGKSRLVRHLTDRATADGFAVHAGAGDPIERGAPYHGWRPVLAAALGLDGLPADRAAQRARAGDRLAAVHPGRGATAERDLATLLAVVLPDAIPADADRLVLSGEARGAATRDLIAELLGTLAGAAPTLVVLEDAHWLDSASLALALRLASAPGPLLLVLTTRPIAESARTELEHLVAIPGCQRLRVGPLLASEAIELGARAIGSALPPGLEALIEAKAGGNPLFACELAYSLRDAGSADADDDAPRRPAPDRESPDRVETVIASRVDRLPPAAKTLLKVASVLGLTCPEGALEELAGPRALDHRVHLVEIGLLVPAPLGTLAFAHGLIRDVVYSQLLYAQRRDLHRRAAEYFERTGAPGSTPAALAHHWEQADLPARAVEYLAAAGQAALQAGAFRECLDAYQRALRLTSAEPPHGRRAEWTWLAAQACYRLGEIDRSLELGARAIAALDRPVPPGRAPAVAAAALAELARQAVHRALPALLPRPAPAAERHQLRLAVEALAMMAEVYYVAADKARSSYVAVRALNLAERLGPSGELAGSYGTMCVIAGLVGAHRLAERYGELSRRTSAAVDDPYWRALSLQQLCHYRSGVGPYGAFSELYAAAIDAYRQLGHRPRLRDTAGMAGIAAHIFGRPDAAEQRMHELLGAVAPQEATLGEAWAHLWLGMVALRRGRVDQALEQLRTVDELRDRHTADVISVNARGICALANWRSGRDAQAGREEDAARALVRRLGRRPAAHFVLDGYVALNELALARWDEARSPAQRGRARWRARDASRNLRSYARVFPIGEPARRLYQGERARRLGRPDRAQTAWRQALAAASRLDMRHELALAHAALGDHLPDGPEREEHRARGAALLAELGAPAGTRAVTPRPVGPIASPSLRPGASDRYARTGVV